MEIKLGFNIMLTDCVYPHTPDSEKKMFSDCINYMINDLFNDQENYKGVEIGVLNGETSGFLLDIDKKISLVGIDPLIPDSMEQSLIGSLELINSNTSRASERFQFINDYSFNVVNQFKDKSIDFLFIDGDHTYNAVEKDFNLYFPKVKEGGLIFMHDSRMFRGGANFHKGSSEFCDFVIENNKEVILVAEAFSLTCFAKKISI